MLTTRKILVAAALTAGATLTMTPLASAQIGGLGSLDASSLGGVTNASPLVGSQDLPPQPYGQQVQQSDQPVQGQTQVADLAATAPQGGMDFFESLNGAMGNTGSVGDTGTDMGNLPIPTQQPTQQPTSHPTKPASDPDPVTPTTQTPPPTNPTTPSPQTSDQERALTNSILLATNAWRAVNGVQPLVRDSRLDVIAQNWSEQQLANNKMSHNPSVFQQIPAGWKSAAENVEQNWTDVGGQGIVDLWKTSPGHNAAMLDPKYNRIGIGAAVGPGDIVYATQDFGQY